MNRNEENERDRTQSLQKDDYEEPKCLLNMDRTPVEPIPVGRMIEKLDEYLSRDDYAGAERHLKYWLSEAEAGADDRGRLTVLNELIGLYRKIGKEQQCMQAIGEALALSEALGLQDSVTGGTTYVNAATGYEAFGLYDEALSHYEKARTVYEKVLREDDARLGGLYNNMALCLTAHERFREAEDLFFRALSVMERQEGGEPEMAITYLNLCDLVSAKTGAEAGEARIGEYLDRAEALLYTEGLPQDGNYAFVCEKCAPVFGFYGRFLTELELRRRAKAIHER